MQYPKKVLKFESQLVEEAFIKLFEVLKCIKNPTVRLQNQFNCTYLSQCIHTAIWYKFRDFPPLI